jgi:integrase
LNGTWVNHRFQAATKAAGLPKLRYHDLRHSCASLVAGRTAARDHGATRP